MIKFTEKVIIPQEDHAEVNFVGLIIGPRGTTLKNLEKDVSVLASSSSARRKHRLLRLDQCQNRHSRYSIEKNHCC